MTDSETLKEPGFAVELEASKTWLQMSILQN
jgi:hypothetical protein